MEHRFMYEYDQMLLRQRKTLPSPAYPGSPRECHRQALSVIRYAVEYYLKWSPDDVYDYFNKEVVRKMKLDSAMASVIYPPELDRGQDYFYVACLLYPRRFPMGTEELAIKVYRDILDGKRARFPKQYMSESKGQLRACICLQYVLRHYLSFGSVREIYAFFAEPGIKNTLKAYWLANVCSEFFPTPLEYLHASLPETQRSRFYLTYYRFREENKISADNFPSNWPMH